MAPGDGQSDEAGDCDGASGAPSDAEDDDDDADDNAEEEEEEPEIGRQPDVEETIVGEDLSTLLSFYR